MTRPDITKFLSRLLENRLYADNGHFASEVTLDYGTTDVRRIDYMMFKPDKSVSVSGIEKGIFTCFEIKSSKEDFHSGYGQNFIAEKNYFVMPMQVYKEVINELFSPKYYEIGVMVPVPLGKEVNDEFDDPTPLDSFKNWVLYIIKPAHQRNRKRSMIELLFCMLRAGK